MNSYKYTKLSYASALPWMEGRLDAPTSKRNLRQNITDLLPKPNETSENISDESQIEKTPIQCRMFI